MDDGCIENWTVELHGCGMHKYEGRFEREGVVRQIRNRARLHYFEGNTYERKIEIEMQYEAYAGKTQK